MNPEDTKVAARDVFLVSLALCINFVTLAVLIVGGFLFIPLIREGASTHKGVCLYRDGLQEQITDSMKYLADHPNGAPALGITASQIQAQIARQQAAVDALSILNCG